MLIQKINEILKQQLNKRREFKDAWRIVCYEYPESSIIETKLIEHIQWEYNNALELLYIRKDRYGKV